MQIMKKVKQAIALCSLASMFIVPAVAGAAAPIGATPLIPQRNHPSAIGNYIKNTPHVTGDVLGLGRGYDIVPLSTGDVVEEDNEGMWMESTAYSPYEGGTYTATGDYVRYGIAAVDTNLIPLGTNLYVEGYGHALAADTGGAIKGNRIDLAFDTYQEAINWGRRDVLVKIV